MEGSDVFPSAESDTGNAFPGIFCDNQEEGNGRETWGEKKMKGPKL